MRFYKVKCDSCDTIFEVAYEDIGPLGRLVRCSECEHEWMEYTQPQKILATIDKITEEQKNEASTSKKDDRKQIITTNTGVNVKEINVLIKDDAHTGENFRSSNTVAADDNSLYNLKKTIPSSHTLKSKNQTSAAKESDKQQIFVEKKEQIISPPSRAFRTIKFVPNQKNISPTNNSNSSWLFTIIVNIAVTLLIITGYSIYSLVLHDDQPIINIIFETVGVDFHKKNSGISINKILREIKNSPYKHDAIHISLENRGKKAELVRMVEIDYYSGEILVGRHHIKPNRIIQPGDIRNFVFFTPNDHRTIDRITLKINRMNLRSVFPLKEMELLQQ